MRKDDREAASKLIACYERHNARRESFPRRKIEKHIGSGETESLLAIAEDIQCAWAAMVRQVCRDSGLKVCRAADLMQCPCTPMVRFMREETNTIPLSAVVAIADLCGTSIERLYYKEELFPLVLPRKHMMWIRRLRELPEDIRTVVKVQLRYTLTLGKKPVTPTDYAGLVGQRLVEYADEYAIRLEDLGRERGLILDRSHRLSLQNTYSGKTFRGRTAKILLFGAMTGCALDYYLRWDYSCYGDTIVDTDGNKVILDQNEREILSLLLRCGEQKEAERAVGWICAVAEDWPETKNGILKERIPKVDQTEKSGRISASELKMLGRTC